MPRQVLNHPDHRDVTLQSIDDYGRQLLKAIERLSIEEARWMPTPESNHILWILWHIGRMEDMWGWYLREGGESAWIEGGWANRLGINTERNGAGDSIDQVRNFPDLEVEEVTEYWQVSRNLLIPAIKQISNEMLTIKRPEIWTHAPDRAPTLLWVLGRLPVENGQHTGHISYIRGLFSSNLS